jgi:beta-lactamase class A
VNRTTFLTAAAGAATALMLPHAAQASALSAHLAAIDRDLPGTLGVTCRTLADAPPLFSYNGTMSFPTASTIKVLIMTTAFALEERHPGTLNAYVTTRRGDLIGGSPFMEQAADGERFRVRELIIPMIQLSDNTASNALIGHFGVKTINATGKAAGMKHTHLARKFLDYTAIVHHQDNVTTPTDMAQLLYLIAHGAREEMTTIVSAKHCHRMIDIMLGQTDRDGIPAALPPHTQIANKTGEIDGTRNDIAIIEPFGESPYVLTIYTKDVQDYNEAFRAIHRVAALSYSMLKSSTL